MIRGANEAGGVGIALARIRGRLRGRLAWAIGILFFIGVSVGMVAARGAHHLARLGLRLVDARAAAALARRREALVPRPRVRLAAVRRDPVRLRHRARGRRQPRHRAAHHAPRSTSTARCSAAPIPTVWLQDHLYHPFAVRWYDYGVFGVYMTHFFATVVVAALLWRYAYPQFRRFRTLVLALTAAGFLTYVLFPATPPWLAAQQGHLPYIHRVIGEMWNHTDGLYPAAGPVRERQRLRERGGGHAVAPRRLPGADPDVLLGAARAGGGACCSWPIRSRWRSRSSTAASTT